MRNWAFLLTLLVLANPREAGAASPSPESVLSSIRARSAGSGSIRMTFVQQYAPAGFGDTAPETGRLTLQAPASLRFDYDGSEGKVFTFDGKAARQFVEADRQMVVKKLSEGERSRLPLLFFEDPSALLTRFHAVASLSENGLTTLTLTPKEGREPKSLTLLTDKLGDVKKLIIIDGAGNRTTFTFTNREAGKKRPTSDFELVPPRGTKIIAGDQGEGREAEKE